MVDEARLLREEEKAPPLVKTENDEDMEVDMEIDEGDGGDDVHEGGKEADVDVDVAYEEQEATYVPKDLDDALTPRKGMAFSSVNDAFSFYKVHAFRAGFSPVRHTKYTYEGCQYRATFFCSCGGQRRTSKANAHAKARADAEADAHGVADLEHYLQRRSGRTQHKSAEQWTDCHAAVVICDRKMAGRWIMESVKLEHNHPCDPDMVRFVRFFREIPETVRKERKITDEMCELVEKSASKITENRKFPTRPKRVGGSGGVSVSINSGRVKKAADPWLGPQEIDAIMEFLGRMQAKKPIFSHSFDIGDDGRMRSIFWADARARSMYHHFGDIVALDLIYLSGTSPVPLAVFLGVNNHGNHVLLGCGLLANETKESFSWLLRRWLRCMKGQPPEAITTNYCSVIRDAVAEVLPDARHRFCMRNVLKKLLENMDRSVFDKETVTSAFNKVAYDTLTVTDFEKEWASMVEQFQLKNNDWVSSLYACRKQWAPVYVNHTFWAGMSATRGVEKPEPFFDCIVSLKTTLASFLNQYDAALKAKVEKEAYDDLRSWYHRPQIISGLQFEEQISQLYTTNMFQTLQDEVKQLMNVICREADRSGTVVRYMVGELIGDRKVDYTVVYNSSDQDVWCICRLFQCRGILCSHALAVLRQEYVMLMPRKYIVDRWKKDFKLVHAVSDSNDIAVEQGLGNYDELYLRGHQYLADIVEVGSREPELKQYVLSIVTEAKDKVARYRETQLGDGVTLDANIVNGGGRIGGFPSSLVGVSLESDLLTAVQANMVQLHPP